MQIKRAGDMEWAPMGLSHRNGDIGEGEREGETCNPKTAAHVEAGTTATLTSASDSTLLTVTIPAI